MSWHVLYQLKTVEAMPTVSYKRIGWPIATCLDTTNFFLNFISVPAYPEVLRLTKHSVLWHRDAMKIIILYGLSVSKCPIELYCQ